MIVVPLTLPLKLIPFLHFDSQNFSFKRQELKKLLLDTRFWELLFISFLGGNLFGLYFFFFFIVFENFQVLKKHWIIQECYKIFSWIILQLKYYTLYHLQKFWLEYVSLLIQIIQFKKMVNFLFLIWLDVIFYSLYKWLKIQQFFIVLMKIVEHQISP